MQLRRLQSAAVANWEDGRSSSNGTVPVTDFDNAVYRQSAYCSCSVCCGYTTLYRTTIKTTEAETVIVVGHFLLLARYVPNVAKRSI